MNILFLSFDADPPFFGGCSTVVNVLAKYFIGQGHHVSLAYTEPQDHPSQFFKKKILFTQANKRNVKEFFIKENIDIIYNIFGDSSDWSLINEVKGHAAVISAYHGRPDLRPWPRAILLSLLRKSTRILTKLHMYAWISVLPIYNIFYKRKMKNGFKKMYDNSDNTMLLSNNYINILRKFVPYLKLEKVYAIPNPLVFNELYDYNKLEKKFKTVLIVAANSQYVKRSNLIIDIWAEIEKNPRLDGWNLEIVGPGYEKEEVQVKRLGLKRVTFFGRQNPTEYYRRASITMMTSRYEGFPMVLLEAMQMGVVPVVYNSFEALPDIITDNETGLIIENNNQKEFVARMTELMLDSDKRMEMQKNAIESCSRFAIEVIGKQYEDYFNRVINDKKNRMARLA